MERKVRGELVQITRLSASTPFQLSPGDRARSKDTCFVVVVVLLFF